MNHDEYQERLSALLDGELDDAEREEVCAHLTECEECRAYFAELNALREALRDTLGEADEADVPEGFAEGVVARLRDSAAPRRGKRGAWRGIAALAACAAVAVLAINALPRMGSFGGSAPKSGSSAPDVQYTLSTAEAAPEAPMLAESKQARFGVPAAETYEPSAMPEETEEASAEFSTDTAGAPEAAYGAGADTLREAAYDEAPALTLLGDGAAEWLAEHAEPLGDGRWRVAVEDVNALPDTLELLAGDGLQEPEDGMLIVTLGTVENPR